MNNKEPGYVNILTNPSFREDGFEIDKSIHPVEVMELRKNQQPVPLIIDGPCVTYGECPRIP